MAEEEKILNYLEDYDLRRESLEQSITANSEATLSKLRYLASNEPGLFTASVQAIIIATFPLQARICFSILHELASHKPENRSKILSHFIKEAEVFPKDALDAVYYLIHNDKELVNQHLVAMLLKHVDADPRRAFDAYQALVVKRPEFVSKVIVQQVLERIQIAPIIAFRFLRLVSERIPELAPLCALGLFECLILEEQYVLKNEMLQAIYAIAGLSHVMTSLEQDLRRSVATGTRKARGLMSLIFGQKMRAQQAILLQALDFAVHWKWIWDFFEFLLEISSKKNISTRISEKFLEGAYRLGFLLTLHDFEYIFARKFDVENATPMQFDSNASVLNNTKVAVLAGKANLLSQNLQKPFNFSPNQEYNDQMQSLEREIKAMVDALLKGGLDPQKQANLQKRLQNCQTRAEQWRVAGFTPKEQRKWEERLVSILTHHIIEMETQFMGDLKVIAVQKVAKRVLGYEADLWKVDEKLYPAMFLLEKLGRGSNYIYLKRIIEDTLWKRDLSWLWTEPPVLRWKSEVLRTSPTIRFENWRAPFKKAYAHRRNHAVAEKKQRLEMEIANVKRRIEGLKFDDLTLPNNPTLEELERIASKIPPAADATIRAEIQADLARARRIADAPVSDYDGVIEIEVETDPFQYLFMGEYGFASCLSMSGAYFWAAVSNAIDVDKVVLWAREENRNIVGRRLLALVPGGILSYRTYANRHGLGLDRFFQDFVATYAEHCNTVQIHQGSPRPLLSDRWYDDSPI